MFKLKVHGFKIKLGQNNHGQSTIEFALTMVFLIAFFLFYFQLSMFFAFASYVHYATFMSARAYLAASQSEEDQKSRAREVIVLMLKKSSGQAGVDKFPLIAKGVGGGDPGGFVVGQHSRYQDGDRALSWLEGVRYTFQGKIFLIPLAGLGQKSGSSSSANRVTLTAESWLGREPSYEDCQSLMGGSSGTVGGFFDNGC